MRKVMFWSAVAAVSVVANYGVEVAAPYFPGLARFTAKAHKGAA